MADLDVVPKRRIAPWIWVVVALVVIVALWMMLGGSGNSSRAGTRLRPAVVPPAVAVATVSIDRAA